MTEQVEHPDHYNWHPVAECVDISEHFPHHLASAIEYIWRCHQKGDDWETHLRKAIWWIERYIEFRKKFNDKNNI
jgi:hypothetical protein